MTSEDVADFFSRRNRAWNNHDVAALTANHSEEGEVESPLAGSVRGRSAIQKVYREWFLSFPDVEYFPEHLLTDGNRAVQFVRMIGTQKGEFCGFAPSGKRFDVRCAFLFFLEGDQISREIRIYDFTSILLQLGVLKAKPGF